MDMPVSVKRREGNCTEEYISYFRYLYRMVSCSINNDSMKLNCAPIDALQQRVETKVPKWQGTKEAGRGRKLEVKFSSRQKCV